MNFLSKSMGISAHVATAASAVPQKPALSKRSAPKGQSPANLVRTRRRLVRRRRLLHCASRSRLGRIPRTVHNADVNNLYRTKRLVVRGISGHVRYLLHQHDGSLVTLAENRVAAVQMGRGDFGDEKLRAIGAGPRVGIGQPARPV